jgi:hypothetical protein
MRDQMTGNDGTATAALLLSALLQAWEPSSEDIAWLAKEIALRADGWAELAGSLVDDEESALSFDPRWHD